MILILVLYAPLAYRDPYVTIPEQVEVRAGETAHIEVTIKHVQTTMWSLKVYADTDQIDSRFLERITIVQDEENPLTFDDEIPSGEEVKAVIEVEVLENSPAGEVRIPIIAAGAKGPCKKGCEPFLVQKSTILAIIRQDPRLALLLPESSFEAYPGENITVEVQLRNYSGVTAYIDSLEATPDKTLEILKPSAPSNVASGNTASVVITIITKDAAPGNYLVQIKLVYRDQIQNKFTESKTVYVTILEKNEPTPSTTPPVTVNPTPPASVNPHNEEEKYVYFMTGMVSGAGVLGVGVMVGLFLKKRRPAP